MSLEPQVSPGFLLWHVTLRWQRQVASALAPLDLTHVQFVLLATCWWMTTHGSPPSQLDLARQAGTDIRMTSQVLRRLERKGLIDREEDAVDARVKRVSVSLAGARLAQQAIEVVEGVDRAFFEPVPDQDETLKMLRTLAGVDDQG